MRKALIENTEITDISDDKSGDRSEALNIDCVTWLLSEETISQQPSSFQESWSKIDSKSSNEKCKFDSYKFKI